MDNLLNTKFFLLLVAVHLTGACIKNAEPRPSVDSSANSSPPPGIIKVLCSKNDTAESGLYCLHGGECWTEVFPDGIRNSYCKCVPPYVGTSCHRFDPTATTGSTLNTASLAVACVIGAVIVIVIVIVIVVVYRLRSRQEQSNLNAMINRSTQNGNGRTPSTIENGHDLQQPEQTVLLREINDNTKVQIEEHPV